LFCFVLFFNGKVFPESSPWEKIKLNCLAWKSPSWVGCANFTACLRDAGHPGSTLSHPTLPAKGMQ